jgi:hypothetical protein
VAKPRKQSNLVKYALRYPVRMACWSAILMAVWTTVIVGQATTGVGAGLGMFLLQWFLWRPGGLARAREERLFPPDRSGDGSGPDRPVAP